LGKRAVVVVVAGVVVVVVAAVGAEEVVVLGGGGPEAAFALEPEPDVDGAVEVEAVVPAVDVAVPGVLEDAAGVGSEFGVGSDPGPPGNPHPPCTTHPTGSSASRSRWAALAGPVEYPVVYRVVVSSTDHHECRR
jgi:hypothetical protein